MIYHVDWTIAEFARVYSAVDENGEILSDLVLAGKTFKGPGIVEIATGPPKVADFAHSISREMIISKRVLELVNCSEINVVAVPVKIVKRKQVIAGEYFILIPKQMHIVLDKRRAQFTEINHVVFDVQKWVIDKSMMPSDNLVFAEPGDWLASEEFVYSCTKLGASGVEFTALEFAT